MIALHVAGMTLLFLAITLLVMAAGTLTALALGLTNRLLLLIVGLVNLGVLGMLVFWTYLIGSGVGRIVAAVLLLGCGLACVLAAGRVRRAGTGRLLLPLLAPTGFFCASSLFSAATGYLRGGTDLKLGLAGQSRYLMGLPDDNELPWYLIRQLQAPGRPLPHFLARPWQTSDRPPMQSGIYLLEHSLFGNGRFLDYQLVSLIAQSLWIFGVWAFLVSARVPSRLVALGLAVTAFSGFTIINTFFVWPKLLPGAFLMLVGAALLSGYLHRLRRSRGTGLLIGLAVGCAMLGHPGSIFVVISMALTLLVVRNRLSLRLIATAVLGVVVMYLPWMLFQRYYAPPGDFLDKFQLANTRNYLDKRSLPRAIADAYRAAGWHGTLSNKWHNLTRPFQDSMSYPAEIWHMLGRGPWSMNGGGSLAAYQAELSAFFDYVPALGFMAFGIIALVIRAVQLMRRERVLSDHPPTRSAARSAELFEPARVGLAGLLCLIITYVIWAAVLFGPGATIVIQSSYFMELIGFCLGAMGGGWCHRACVRSWWRRNVL